MTKSGILGDALDQLGGLAKQTGKAVVKTPGHLAQTAAKQVGVTPETAEVQKGKEAPTPKQQQAVTEARKSQNQEIVSSLYAPSKETAQDPAAQTATAVAEENPKKSPEEIQKIAQLKQQLHQTTYYQPLVTPPKQQEEKPAEKVEREKIEDLQEKQEKQEDEVKKAPIQQAQNIEKHRGAHG